MYADDHQLYFKGQTVKCVEKQLNEGGHIMLQGYKDNFLKGNYEKWKVMLKGRNMEKPSINVMVDNKPIESSPGMKLLGVTLDDNLNYKVYTCGICSKQG